MKQLSLTITALAFSSCMHMGVMGTGDGHHSGTAHEMTTDFVLEKEVIVGHVKAIALFPPLIREEEKTLTLRLMDAGTTAPISGAEVYLHAEYVPGTENISTDKQVLETAEPGVYAITYASEQEGEHTLMFHITAIGGLELDPKITIEAKMTVLGDGHEHQSGMMGGTSTTTLVIIGAAVMGAVMIAMLASHGGMW